ncbi:MAG: hypothetical protein CMJ83_08285 [Planctomycetes bacterium]|jgi:hypothetical protein|nr:hypothetical protein [Planctomycetota bacterium]
MTTAAPIRTLDSQEVNLLLAWLAEETEAHRQMGEILARQQRCMVRQDLVALQQCHDDAGPAARRLENATKSRGQVLVGLGRRLGIPGDPPALDSILQFAPDDARNQLELMRQTLQDALDEIRAQTRRNQMLARSGLDLNRSIVHAIFAGGEAQRTYDRGARTHDRPTSVPFLDREL